MIIQKLIKEIVLTHKGMLEDKFTIPPSMSYQRNLAKTNPDLSDYIIRQGIQKFYEELTEEPNIWEVVQIKLNHVGTVFGKPDKHFINLHYQGSYQAEILVDQHRSVVGKEILFSKNAVIRMRKLISVGTVSYAWQPCASMNSIIQMQEAEERVKKFKDIFPKIKDWNETLWQN